VVQVRIAKLLETQGFDLLVDDSKIGLMKRCGNEMQHFTAIDRRLSYMLVVEQDLELRVVTEYAVQGLAKAVDFSVQQLWQDYAATTRTL
jgi:hypothetical protein